MMIYSKISREIVFLLCRKIIPRQFRACGHGEAGAVRRSRSEGGAVRIVPGMDNHKIASTGQAKQALEWVSPTCLF